MPHDPNFLGDTELLKKKQRFFYLKILGGAILLGATFGILTVKNTPDSSLLAALTRAPVIRQVRELVLSGTRELRGENNDRINILLLGMGGVRHEGPYLTDTILLASIKPSTGQAALISVPRDLAVPIPDLGWAKLNSANAYGESKKIGGGPELVRKILEDVLGLPIHYYVRADFEGFKKIIDEVGGIDVYVEHNFTDPAYPTGVNGDVATISFEGGWQKMDGERALQFARSRHGDSGEGSDFARSRRQQKILLALRKKITSLETLRSPHKISEIIEAAKEHISSNISPREVAAWGKLALSVNPEKMLTAVLDDSPNGLLTPTIGQDGAYLLVPKENNWNTIQNFAANIFESASPVAEKIKQEPARVEIQNGTDIAGLAAETANLLEREGYGIVSIGNATERGRTKTVIYDLTDGERSEDLRRLRTLLDADISLSAPGWIRSEKIIPDELRLTEIPAARARNADFLIILGAP